MWFLKKGRISINYFLFRVYSYYDLIFPVYTLRGKIFLKWDQLGPPAPRRVRFPTVLNYYSALKNKNFSQ